MTDYTQYFIEAGKKARATLNQQGLVKAYPGMDDATLGQMYLKNTNPLQYEMIQRQQQSQQAIDQATQMSNIQSQKELDVNKQKMQQERQFKIDNPTPLTPKEQADLDVMNTQKDTANKNKSVTISLVDELLGRDTGAVTGAKNPFKYLTGEGQYTENLVKELQAKLSLSGREQLKGSGAISDFEVKMLADSVSALKTNLSNEDFYKELNKIKTILNGGIPRANEGGTQNGQVKWAENGKEIINNILGIPSQIANIPQNAVNLQKQYGSMGQSIISGKGPGRDLLGSALGMLPEYNQALGEPLKGGDVVGRIVNRAKEKPITTALDAASLLPFLKVGKGNVPPKVAEVKTGSSISDIPNLSNAEKLAVQGAEKIGGATKKAGEIMPRAWLTKAKTNAFELYKNVTVDKNVITQAAEDYIKRYPSARGVYDKYKTAVESIKTPKDLDNVLKEWSDIFKTNKEIKPGIGNDLIGEMWKAGRKELAQKAPMVDKIKQTMGETMDLSKEAGKALWKAVLGKILLGR